MTGAKTKRRAQHGFTLIEMMIVVAIVGVLAVLAIYGVRKYISSSKTAEATNQLGTIAKDAADAYSREGTGAGAVKVGIDIAAGTVNAGVGVRSLCPTSSRVPLSPPAASKYQSATTEWSGDTGWMCLKFQIDEPQYFAYQYKLSNAASYVAVANGDLNGDGVASTFSVSGTVVDNAVVNAVTVLQTNPEE